ncbi:DHA1 family bicyclomycin/chloramphenicol resistance-like MFS transporter [Kribbella orskensis]|uniref:DHA1 family bicyclomycin/chloramphenicol resistance-like MFS transporter n=1 Tax=Kribbella orskensis TaxID=2512216 RepID=A0ABY2B7Z3_9ACTN|nr:MULTISPECIES: multidrug effflux MFS transporter [Kribbella]TCN30638.1 DHA1 family bicyclomycin/chloramphenicol resistance-like MFS transporter [Kribbella sp. VKM Ac-2500]TCO11357.1 DHA1 family bicyclomycin/chloramphenicol resistance-like MFS transporter [Kribbella orskensis]
MQQVPLPPDVAWSTPPLLKARRQARLTAGLVATVVFLTAIAPLATDMYVPAFPRVAGELSSTATQVQLTLTTFFVGMALGQLIGGPVSDQRGRRIPLLTALLAMTAASIVCALAPTIAVMTVARLVQGFAGGWAMVIGRAIIVDLATGAQLVRVLNVIAAVGGIAPIVGPLLGGLILQLSHWRVSFWLVAALGLAMASAVVVTVPESLSRERRHAGGLRNFLIVGRIVLGNREYVGYLLVAGAAMGALFAYVATSAFVLQTMNGLSPVAYSIDFAANAAGMTVAALVAARLAGRVSTRKVILTGQLAALCAGAAMLTGALWFETPLSLAIVCFFVLMTAQGLIIPNGGALASTAVSDHPGTGSALQGFVQWVAAGTIAPIAGLGGATTAVPMAALMTAGITASVVGLLVAARATRDPRPTHRRPREPLRPDPPELVNR